jgi:biotin synthase
MPVSSEIRNRAPLVEPRHDWTRDELRALFALPLPELIFRAQTAHRQCFDPREVQVSTLLSIKTGGCPEDCAYCPQSAHYDTGVDATKLMSVDAALAAARAAQQAGATRFCMGAAWRRPTTAISTRSVPWSRAFARWASKAASRSAC